MKQTRKSYIYVYKKLCEKYNKTPINGYEDALNFSVEYIINSPDGTCFSGAYEVLKYLSNQ